MTKKQLFAAMLVAGMTTADPLFAMSPQDHKGGKNASQQRNLSHPQGGKVQSQPLKAAKVQPVHRSSDGPNHAAGTQSAASRIAEQRSSRQAMLQNSSARQNQLDKLQQSADAARRNIPQRPAKLDKTPANLGSSPMLPSQSTLRAKYANLGTDSQLEQSSKSKDLSPHSTLSDVKNPLQSWDRSSGTLARPGSSAPTSDPSSDMTDDEVNNAIKFKDCVIGEARKFDSKGNLIYVAPIWGIPVTYNLASMVAVQG